MLLRITVIGAGAIGASVALRLAQRGAQVTLVERDRFDRGLPRAPSQCPVSEPGLAPGFQSRVDGFARKAMASTDALNPIGSASSTV